MPVRIKIAETAAELGDLFVARHRVFVEEEGYLAPKANGRIVDHFDAFPTTTNIIALMDDRVVGGIRITTSSSAGLPSDQFFNFSPFFQDRPATIAGVSQFFVLKQHRANSYRIGFAMMGMCAYWASKQNLTHLVAAVNPVIAPILKIVGMKPVAPQYFHDGDGVDVLPMIMDMKQIKEPLVSTIRRQKHHTGPENFDREFYLPGEPIGCFDQDPLRDYRVIKGRIMVHDLQQSTKPSDPKLLLEIGPGQSLKDFGLLPFRSNTMQLSAGSKAEVMVTNRSQINADILTTDGYFQSGTRYLPSGNIQPIEPVHAVQ